MDRGRWRVENGGGGGKRDGKAACDYSIDSSRSLSRNAGGSVVGKGTLRVPGGVLERRRSVIGIGRQCDRWSGRRVEVFETVCNTSNTRVPNSQSAAELTGFP